MFSIGFFCMFSLAFFETLNMKKIAVTGEIKNLLTALLVLVGGLVSIICFLSIPIFFDINYNMDNNLLIFSDWKLYVSLTSEVFGVYLTRKNFEVNGNNIVAINFAMFFSLVLVPLYSFFFTNLFGFEETLTIKYENNTEFYGFIAVMIILTILFFIDKLKDQKINNIKLLILVPIILSNSMFFTGKLMQEYDGFFAYTIISLFLVFPFLFLALKASEFKNYNKEKHLKTTLFFIATWAMVIPLNTIAIKILAIEFVTLLKRISQIISGIIVDFIYGNKNNLNIKDYIIIILIISTGLLLYVKRG